MAIERDLPSAAFGCAYATLAQASLRYGRPLIASVGCKKSVNESGWFKKEHSKAKALWFSANHDFHSSSHWGWVPG